MAKQSILNEAQHKRAHSLYMKDGRPPSEIAAILNAEFQADGLNVTPRQLSEYASTRNWGTKRKAMKVKGEAKASQLVTAAANEIAAQRIQHLEKHRDFMEASVRIGGKIMTKAETIVDNSTNARDLASAANAAAKGIEIYRKAVGIDDGSAGPVGNSGNTFVFNFARAPDSPFTKPVSPGNTTEESAEVVDLVSDGCSGNSDTDHTGLTEGGAASGVE